MNLGSEGKEISLDEDSEEWSALHVEPGAVLEVALEATNLGVTDESWAAFFVEKLENRLDGSYLLTTEWLGVESDSLVSLLEAFFGDGVPKLHLCLSKPCMEAGFGDALALAVLHVTRIRWWRPDNFKADYLGRKEMDHLKKLWKDLKKATAPKRPRKAKADAGAGKPPGAEKAKAKAGPAKKSPPVKETEKMTKADKDKLRARLEKVRQRHHGTPGDPRDVEEVPSGSDHSGDDGKEELSQGYSPSEVLDTGTLLRKKTHRGRDSKDHDKKAREIVPYVGSRGDGTKSLNGQLVNRALAIGRARHEERKKKKKKGATFT